MLIEYANENPPVHLLVKAFLGVPEKPKYTWENESWESLVQRWSAAGGGLLQ